MRPDELAAAGDAELRELLSAAVAEYSRRTQAAVDGGGEPSEPLDPQALTATDVLITAGRMLQTFDIAPFELGALHY